MRLYRDVGSADILYRIEPARFGAWLIRNMPDNRPVVAADNRNNRINRNWGQGQGEGEVGVGAAAYGGAGDV